MDRQGREFAGGQPELYGAQHAALGVIEDMAVEDPGAGSLVEANEQSPGLLC